MPKTLSDQALQHVEQGYPLKAGHLVASTG
jgi:hypothetical protein